MIKTITGLSVSVFNETSVYKRLHVNAIHTINGKDYKKKKQEILSRIIFVGKFR